MPAIVPPVDEIAIGHQFPGCKQDHQYTGRHAAYRSRYRLVADCPRCNQQSQTEEKPSLLLQIGRNDKSLYGKQNDEQPKHDGYPSIMRCKADIDQALPMDFMITPRKRISDAVDDAARRPTAPRAPAVLDPIAAIARSCAMSEVAAEIEAEQGIRATCPATPMLSDA
jgi:hypothetical protein